MEDNTIEWHLENIKWESFKWNCGKTTLNHNLKRNKVVNTKNGLYDYFPLAKPVSSSKQSKWANSDSFSQPSALLMPSTHFIHELVLFAAQANLKVLVSLIEPSYFEFAFEKKIFWMGFNELMNYVNNYRSIQLLTFYNPLRRAKLYLASVDTALQWTNRENNECVCKRCKTRQAALNQGNFDV